MPEMPPELARLVRLSNDELCLIAWYRYLTPKQKEYLQDIAATLAESQAPEEFPPSNVIRFKPPQA
jgi:hypothetical protein